VPVVSLDADEIAELDRQDPATKNAGGFENYLIQLQQRIDRSNNRIELTDQDAERIARYAFDYKNGGWQKRLIAIFGRTLGAQLGR
jgi:hypothetical protein